MRDGFVFYRSFFESFSDLSKKDKLVLFDALCNYALNDIEPELVGVPAAIFKLLKPQVDANNRRYENGLKGGRPKKNQEETKQEPNNNQTKTKQEPKDKEKDKDKDKEKEQGKDKQQQANAVGGRGLGDDDSFNIWKRLTPHDVDKIYEVYPNSADDLIQTVYEEVKSRRTEVDNPVAYILGYAKNVNWDDKADHFDI
ncbi:MAG: hypothetical protein IIY21_07595 [Clostridiales bacterium]|nr:hypothetical protein [Clostridiales bacterium]MBQ1572511.1 hypothetical protein [Clostridiales bacterium]